jgi:hypothetical protein
MSRVVVKPYLVAKHADDDFRITVRTTRLNSQGYPLVSSEMLTESFRTARAARDHLRAQYRAEAIDITSK